VTLRVNHIRGTGAPLVRRTDRLGRLAYAPGEAGSRAVACFSQFAQFVLNQIGVHRPGMVAASLIVFDAIGTLEDLRAALAAIDDVFVWCSRVYLDWEWRKGWIDRRMLSGITCRILAGAPHASATEAITQLTDFARSAVPRWSRHSDREVLDALFDSAMAWSAIHLPGALFAHVIRDAPYQVLPRAVLARSVCSSVPEHPPAEVSLDATEMTLADLTLEPRVGVDIEFIADLAREVRAVLRTHRNHAQARAQLLTRLSSMTPQAKSAGWVGALLILWIRDLATAGTDRKDKLAPATIVNYTGPVLIPLAERLGEQQGFPDQTDVLTTIYEDVRDSASTGNQVNVASALTAFHGFLVRRFAVDPLSRRLHDAIAEAPPRANTVWPHEMDRTLTWLKSGDGDTRLHQSMALAYRLAWAARFRVFEILTLRLRNILQGGMEVEIAPLLRDGKAKTHASVRIVQLDPDAQRALGEWVERRLREGAQSIDLLFGDPYVPERIYRPGAMRLCLSKLLQQATGDTDVVFHTLSHRRAAVALADYLADPGVADVNPLDEIAAQFGHHSPQTLTHYLHSIEGWIRRELDQSLHASLHLTSFMAERLSGEPASRLRKRVSRSRCDDQAVYWAAIDRQAASGQWTKIEAAAQMVEPIPPRWLGKAQTIDPSVVADVLDDLLADVAVPVIASRASVEVQVVERIASSALQTLRLIGAAPARRRTGATAELAATELRAWARSTRAFELRRRHQSKFTDISWKLPRSRQDAVWRAWAEGYHNRYLALGERDADALLLWLADAGVSPLCLAMSAVESNTAASNKALLLAAKYHVAFGITPKMLTHAPRQGRPAVYLVWSSQVIEASPPPPASTSLDGLHAWMLAAGVAAQLTDEAAPTTPNQ